MRIIERIRDVYRARGARGLAAFVGTRIAQRRQDLLFEINLPGADPSPAQESLAQVVVIDRTNVGRAAMATIERQVFVNENGAYRPGLFREDMLFVALDDAGRVLTYAFVLFPTWYKRVLGEADSVPMIGNCFTEPNARGRGLYTRMLRTVTRELARRGHPRAIVSCAPDNLPSVRGIGRAGFRLVRRVETLIVLWRLIVWRRIDPA